MKDSVPARKRILVIGGGFFGMYLAEQLARQGCAVRLVEKDPAMMSRASYANQARVHNGYHYPRSVLTALRSRLSFPRFVEEFRECIDSGFEKYYCIAAPLGKVSAKQFLKFCERIGAPCTPAPHGIRALCNPALIEECFSVQEYAFDAVKLRDLMAARIAAAQVHCSTETSAERVTPKGDGVMVELLHAASGEHETVYADHVFNCTYSRINFLPARCGLDLVPLKHEMTEMCLVDVPDPFKRVGVTVMCGPFFSVMPFPPVGLHSFSHVRYTPHYEWRDGDRPGFFDAEDRFRGDLRHSAWRYMQKDAARYFPVLSECEYRDSLWEVKTVLPRSESDDSRPILFLPHYGLKGFHCVMGGKIDNVYDVLESIDAHNLLS
ncbi:NAD(P)/FAD-dependent oxidoreductase [Geomonas oryzae]|uniref:NAD(P)/FAD-dependent oxidoreductase n=1 Tax=Geomonas oryzae TaxID=2364273 RepID=UPI0018E0AA05|nr:FAD-dependent oxidoreductase [Geomonas oryzae]